MSSRIQLIQQRGEDLSKNCQSPATSRRCVHLYSPSPLNPLGVKGVGEGGAVAPPAAIANDRARGAWALEALGVAPASSEKQPLYRSAGGSYG